jgi:hypothetical protein
MTEISELELKDWSPRTLIIAFTEDNLNEDRRNEQEQAKY